VSRAPRRNPAATAAASRTPREPFFELSAPIPSLARWASPAAYILMGLYAAALVFMIAGPHRVGDVFTESDFYGSYGLGARALLHGRIDPARYGVVGPVYEMLLAAVGFVVRDLFVAAELLALASMTVTLWLWFRIVRSRAGALAGLVATALLAVNAQFFRYGYAATTDAPALALIAGAMALLLVRPVRGRAALVAGIVAGLAFLTRYNAVVLLPAGVVILLAGWTDPPEPDRRGAALRFSAGFLAPVLPWVAFSLLSGAHFRFMLHHNIAYEVFAHARGIPWDTYERTMESQFPTPWSVFARDPGAVTARVFSNVGEHLRLDARRVATWPLAFAAAAGIVLGMRGGGLGRLKGAWLAAALLFLTLVPAFHSERYSLAVLPAWTALAALGFASPRLALVVRAGGHRVWLKPALALLVLAFTLKGSIAFQRGVLSQLPVEVRTVAAAAKPLLRRGDRVYARKPHFAWHAGLTGNAFPFVDSLSQLAAAARRDGVRWLYFSWPEAEMRPQFMYLLDTTSAVPGLTPRVVTTHHPAVLYEIGPGFGVDPPWMDDPWQVALHRARAMVAIDLRDWRSRVMVANEEQRHGRWEGAQPLLEAAIAQAPNDPDVMLALADNLVHLGRYPAATDLYARVEQVQPGNPRTRVGAGWAALLGGHAQEATRIWRPMVNAVDDPGTLQRMFELYTAAHDAAALAEVRDRMRSLGIPEGAADGR
jgi:hypothetical protein